MIHYCGDVRVEDMRPVLYLGVNCWRLPKRTRYASHEEASRYAYRLVARWQRRYSVVK